MGAHAHVHKRPRASRPTVEFTGAGIVVPRGNDQPYEGTRTCCKGSDLRFRGRRPRCLRSAGRDRTRNPDPRARPPRGARATRSRTHSLRSPRPGTRGPTGSSSTSTAASTGRSSSTTTPRSTASGSSPSTSSPRSGPRCPSIPTLDEVFDVCAGMLVNVEVKNSPHDVDFDPEDRAAAAVVELVRGAGPARLGARLVVPPPDDRPGPRARPGGPDRLPRRGRPAADRRARDRARARPPRAPPPPRGARARRYAAGRGRARARSSGSRSTSGP